MPWRMASQASLSGEVPPVGLSDAGGGNGVDDSLKGNEESGLGNEQGNICKRMASSYLILVWMGGKKKEAGERTRPRGGDKLWENCSPKITKMKGQ